MWWSHSFWDFQLEELKLKKMELVAPILATGSHS
jgi:hypothetical protein